MYYIVAYTDFHDTSKVTGVDNLVYKTRQDAIQRMNELVYARNAQWKPEHGFPRVFEFNATGNAMGIGPAVAVPKEPEAPLNKRWIVMDRYISMSIEPKLADKTARETLQAGKTISVYVATAIEIQKYTLDVKKDKIF